MFNSIAAVSSAEKLYQTNATSKMYKSTFLLTGLFSIIGAALGLIPYGPYTSSIGFLESTKILDRVALIIRGAFSLYLDLCLRYEPYFRQFLLGKGVLSYLWPIYNYSVPLHNIQFNSKTIYRIATPTSLL
ncbi:hypothetical protein J7J00_17915 [Bacillus sp. ISL-4]|uniref:solute carrier family 23 protein n=1 Tax=Bacillus sp. ISL-4 TaxID=2819125 RepID=UPI001BEA0172|nr:hypothetical protein [Bacillus sp. ISL-4]MBT2673091.1 hypothetical protein [Streptomyces sp. ISL-14]